MAKNVTKQIKDLKQDIYVRQTLNQERVVQLAELIESGVELNPIQIAPDGRVIDGRHRIEAHELVGRTEISCEIVEVADDLQLISMAYKANAGGALPPTRSDTEHVVMLLLSRRATHKSIGEALGLTPSLARKYIASVKARMERAKLRSAAAAVAEGNLTVAQAAAQFDVDLQALKLHIGGNKKRKKTVANFLAELTQLHRSAGSKLGKTMKRVLEMYEDGELTAKQAIEVIEKLLMAKSRAT
jgi:ParB-like chromosome segregation protein Spo0J